MMPPVIDVGIAQLTLPGETESGDRCVVRLFDSRAMVAVIDGLGHGEEAARAAVAAVEILEASDGEPVAELIARCHDKLRGTRGAAITVMTFDSAAGKVEWTGMGNVSAFLLRRMAHRDASCTELHVRSGIAGGAVLPPIVVSTTTVGRGDTIAIATDGLRRTFVDSIRVEEALQPMAERLLKQYQTARDDALLVVLRVRE